MIKLLLFNDAILIGFYAVCVLGMVTGADRDGDKNGMIWGCCGVWGNSIFIYISTRV